MKLKLCIILFIFFLNASLSITLAQEREILGDSISMNWNKGLNRRLKLIDFRKSDSSFLFRFWNHGQVVEIFKLENKFSGRVFNYIFHTMNNYEDTLVKVCEIDSLSLSKAFYVIDTSKVLEIKTSSEIKNWHIGADGITYIIEHANDTKYFYKDYWSPHLMDSIYEAKVVMNFVKDFSRALNLDYIYKEFKEGLPTIGSYNSGGLISSYYVNNKYSFGYNGLSKLPIGLEFGMGKRYIGRFKVLVSMRLLLRFGQEKNNDVEYSLYKSNLFFTKEQMNDNIVYIFRRRRISFIDLHKTIYNHNFLYNTFINNKFSCGIGFNYLRFKQDRYGLLFRGSSFFEKIGIGTAVNLSIFNDQIDYKFVISKGVDLNDKFKINTVYFNLCFENFQKYNDLIFQIYFLY